MAFINKIGNILKQTSFRRPIFQSSTVNASIYQASRCFSSKLFVGGLSYTTDENSLREAFTSYGNVTEARIIVDRESGRSRGFGFISYDSVEEATAAIQALNGKDLHGRSIKVTPAVDRRRDGYYDDRRGGYGGSRSRGSGRGRGYGRNGYGSPNNTSYSANVYDYNDYGDTNYDIGSSSFNNGPSDSSFGNDFGDFGGL